MPPMPSQIQRTREHSVNPVFDRNGVPLSQVAHRHSSMPTYMEYSTGAIVCFVSLRGTTASVECLSSRLLHHSTTPSEWDTSQPTSQTRTLASTLQSQMLACSSLSIRSCLFHQNLAGAPYPSMRAGFQPQQVYSVLEGSPTYKAEASTAPLSTLAQCRRVYRLVALSPHIQSTDQATFAVQCRALLYHNPSLKQTRCLTMTLQRACTPLNRQMQ